MGLANSLKNRFEKLQQDSIPVTEETVQDQVSVVEKPKLALQASNRPEIHEKVRKSSALSYDWKKQYRQPLVRPVLDSRRTKALLKFEISIQDLSLNTILISFSRNPQLDTTIILAAAHVEMNRSFWRNLLNRAQKLHFSCEKNKLHLGVNYDQYKADRKQEIKRIIENEYLSNNTWMKTFHVAEQDGWVEIILEFTSVDDERRIEEAAL